LMKSKSPCTVSSALRYAVPNWTAALWSAFHKLTHRALFWFLPVPLVPHSITPTLISVQNIDSTQETPDVFQNHKTDNIT
jgi:hypothetical protein